MPRFGRRKTSWQGIVTDDLWFECPGCENLHKITFRADPGYKGPVWSLTGEGDRLTISPSILVTWGEGEQRIPKRCHSFVREGRIQFLTDCTHKLVGQTVDVPELPEWFLKESDFL